MPKMASAQEAIRLVYQNKADVLEADTSRPFRSGSAVTPAPTVIRLKNIVKVPITLRKQVTNTILFARDNYTCQYCGRKERELLSNEFLNREHIHPRSLGGDNTWENCVTACSTCNTRKAAKSLEQSGLTLLKQPTAPSEMLRLKWNVRKVTPLQHKYLTMFYGKNWNIHR